MVCVVVFLFGDDTRDTVNALEPMYRSWQIEVGKGLSGSFQHLFEFLQCEAADLVDGWIMYAMPLVQPVFAVIA